MAVAWKHAPKISTHTPHAGRNMPAAFVFSYYSYFNSHAPCGAQLDSVWCMSRIYIAFQLTRPMRGATLISTLHIRDIMISTHTPHAGRNDDIKYSLSFMDITISTHTPHAGRNPIAVISPSVSVVFQLTRPMRGATPFVASVIPACEFQLTRPMRGATKSLIFANGDVK